MSTGTVGYPSATSSLTRRSTDKSNGAGHGSRSRWMALVILSLAQLMVVLDATIVNIALPSAQQDLAISDDGRQWIITGYALAFGSLLLLGGRLSDFFGRKRLFIIGLIGFAVASAIGGAANGFDMLLLARVAQGAFGAMLAPAALSLLSTTFSEPKERGRAFGIFGAISGAGGAVGLLLGGVLTEYASWRWCLYVNVAIASIALIGALVYFPKNQRTAHEKLDIPGTITAVLGLVGVVYGLANAESHGWGDILTIGPVIAGLLILVIFVLIERRSTHPLLPLRVVLDRDRGGAYIAAGLTGAGMFAVFLFLTYYLTNTLGFTPIQTGAAFLPMLAGTMITATLSGSVILPRTGPRPLVPIGGLLAAVGLALLTGISTDSTYVVNVLPGLVLTGLGIGMIFGPIQNAATSGIESRDAGVASAMINTTQQIGGSIGTAVFSSVAATSISTYLANHAAEGASAISDATISGYHLVFWIGSAVFVGIAAISALVFRSGTLPVNPDADLVISH